MISGLLSVASTASVKESDLIVELVKK